MINRSWSIPLITLFVLSYLFHSSKKENEVEEVEKEKEEIDTIFSKT